MTQGPGAGTAPLSLPATFARPTQGPGYPTAPTSPKSPARTRCQGCCQRLPCTTTHTVAPCKAQRVPGPRHSTPPFLALPAQLGTGTGTGTGMSQPTLSAWGMPVSSRPGCQPQRQLAHTPPQELRTQSLPCPSSAVVGTMPTSSSSENLGCCRVPLCRRSSWIDRHHRVSSAPLSPASKIRPRLGIGRGAQPVCVQLAAPGCGAWHPRTAALTLAKGTPLQALGHRCLLVFSEKGCTPKPSCVHRQARAVRDQAAGRHCQPHPAVTPVPPRAAQSHQPIWVPIQWGQLAWTMAFPL